MKYLVLRVSFAHMTRNFGASADSSHEMGLLHHLSCNTVVIVQLLVSPARLLADLSLRDHAGLVLRWHALSMTVKNSFHSPR